MDLMSVLTAVTHPGVDPEVPDARDPESAAAFTELLATLVAAPALAAAAAAPTGGAGVAGAAPAGGTPAEGAATPVEGVAAAAVTPLTAAVGSDPAAAFAMAGAAATPTSPITVDAGTPAVVPTVDSSVPQSSPIVAPELAPGLVADVADASAVPSDPALPGVEGEGLATAPAAGDAAAADGATTTGVVDNAAQPDPAPAATPVEQPRLQPAAPDLASSTGQATTTTDTSVPTEAVASPIAAAAAADSADDAGADTNADGAGVHALDAAQRTESTSPVAAPSAPAETAGARALERALAMQLANRVGTLSQRPDGEYDLTLQLEPADLGRLELRVRMEGGLVHIQVGAHAASTTEAIRAALPELREALADAGLSAGSLDVGTHTGQSESGASRDRLDRENAGSAAETHVGAGPGRATPTTTLPTLTGADRGVDVLL